jgi:hypothetical protein
VGPGPLGASLEPFHEFTKRDHQTLSHWFNTAAFVNPALFAFGNSPRSVLRGPGIAATDLTLEKSIALTDAVKFDLRVEAYNLFNRANFNPFEAKSRSQDGGGVALRRQNRDFP